MAELRGMYQQFRANPKASGTAGNWLSASSLRERLQWRQVQSDFVFKAMFSYALFCLPSLIEHPHKLPSFFVIDSPVDSFKKRLEQVLIDVFLISPLVFRLYWTINPTIPPLASTLQINNEFFTVSYTHTYAFLQAWLFPDRYKSQPFNAGVNSNCWLSRVRHLQFVD